MKANILPYFVKSHNQQSKNEKVQKKPMKINESKIIGNVKAQFISSLLCYRQECLLKFNVLESVLSFNC